MATNEVISEFIERVLALETEKMLLRDTEKELYADYKEKVDVKAFKAALRIARIRAKLDGGEESEADQILNIITPKV